MLEGSGRKSRWISGVPPLSFKAKKAGELENYRIYGNTVDGESVGDKTPNLFDKDSNMNTHGTVGSLSTEPLTYGFPGSINKQSGTYFMDVLPGEVYTISMETTGDRLSISGLYHSINPNDYTVSNRVVMDTIITVMITGENVPDTYTFTVPPNVVMVAIYYALTSMPTNFQIVKGSTALPYEPYGYKVPVTVSNGTDTQTTPIYLPEQIRKVGDEAEYVDYAEQKMHRISADDINVTLPALPTLTGTNVLSVGTAVQPSEIEVKGKIKAI